MDYQGKSPQIEPGVFIAPGAHIIGAVKIGEDSSVFYNSVVRGDVNHITIGTQTNVQDNCTLHVTGKSCLTVGNSVTVGHNVILHGCTIGDNVLIGMGAIVLDDAEIGADSIVAAGSLVPPGKTYPSGSMIMGSPAKVVRSLSAEEKQINRQVALKYIEVQNRHQQELISLPVSNQE